MKALLLYCLLIPGCNSKQNEKILISDIPNLIDEVLFVSDIPAKYKYGDEILLSNIYSKISNVTLEDVINTQGVYQMVIDTNGQTSNFEVIRSISKTLDIGVGKICDTLEFYPALLNGKKLDSKITLPIRIELIE